MSTEAKKTKRFTMATLCLVVMGLLVALSCVKPTPDPPPNGEGDYDTAFQKYYYAYNEKIYLDVVPDKFVIAYDKQYFSQIQQSLEENTQIKDIEFQIYNGCCVFTMENAKVKTLRVKFGKKEGILSVNPLYVINGSELIITDEIVVQFKENISQQAINEIHKKYRVKLKKDRGIYQVFSVPIDFDPLEVANAYQTSGLVNFSHPNFIREIG